VDGENGEQVGVVYGSAYTVVRATQHVNGQWQFWVWHSAYTESFAVNRTAVALKHNVYDDGGLYRM